MASAQQSQLIRPHHAYVCGAVFFSFAAVDSAINELFVDAAHGYPHHQRTLTAEQARLLASMWKHVKRRRIDERYDVALSLLGQEEFNRRAEPWKSFDLAKQVRNALVHWQPESVSGAPEIPETSSEELERKFGDCPFELNPFHGEGDAFFPTKLLGAGFATWAYRTCINFMDEFFRRIGLEPVYQGRVPTLD